VPAGGHVVGVGVATAATPDELAALVDDVLRSAGVTRDEVAAVATVELRRSHPAVTALGWPVVAFPPDRLPPPPAPAARPAVPGPGARPAVPGPPARPAVPGPAARPAVAEPAALLGAGPGAELVVPKRRSGRSTAALARRPLPPTDP
jgi:cobalamin biosynthesis protein CbiG